MYAEVWWVSCSKVDGQSGVLDVFVVGGLNGSAVSPEI